MVRRTAGFVVFRHNAKNVEYLFLQTAKRGHWTPPKGRVEDQETEKEGAYRELNEETGLLPEDIEIYEDSNHTLTYKRKDKTIIYWLARLVNEDRQIVISNEHINYKWLTKEEACNGVYHVDKKHSVLIEEGDHYIRNKIRS